jgi:light-regulated signal transduction histidine kinase (bacteriophytochrome)
MLTGDLWRDVDELVTTPIRGDELRVRVERLLELRRRSQEAARRVEELDRSNTDLQQFAFVAAHELSTPLTVVTGVIETVNARYGDELQPDVANLLSAARTSSHRLRHLIDDLLVYSQAGHGVELAPVELSVVVAEALEEPAASLDSTGARIEVERLPRVLGDGRQRRLVFVNLIGNAVKYERPGVPPVVRIAAEREDDGWCVSVADNGIGIEPKRAEAMFGMFEREQRGGDRPGSGIGLALCRRIMERHDGESGSSPARAAAPA